MNKRILWVDDDYYAIQGLLRPIEKEGFQLDIALSALDAYNRAKDKEIYDLIIVDLIIPISNEAPAPDFMREWGDTENYEFIGVGLIKWLINEMKVKCPVAILSVVCDPISKCRLEKLGLAGSIQKSDLLPAGLKSELYKFMKI